MQTGFQFATSLPDWVIVLCVWLLAIAAALHVANLILWLVERRLKRKLREEKEKWL